MLDKPVDMLHILLGKLEDVADSELTPDQLEFEARRIDTMVKLTKEALKTYELGLKVKVAQAEYGSDLLLPDHLMIGGGR